MKKKLVFVATIALSLFFAFACLTACSSSDSSDSSDSESTPLTEEEIAANTSITEKDGVVGADLEDGTYEMVSLYLDGEPFDSLASGLSKVGMGMTLVIDGNKATIGEKEYTVENGKLITVDGGEEVPYAVDGNKVSVLDTDNSKMIFEKQQ